MAIYTYSNISNVVSQIANALKEKGVNLNYGDNSSALKLYASGAREEVVNAVTEKFVNELMFYKNIIFPIINRFKDNIHSETVLVKKSSSASVPYTYFSTSKVIAHLFSTKCDKKVISLDPETNGEYISVKIPYENFTEEEIYKLFNNTDDDTFNNYILGVLTKFSNLELKEFIRKYCSILTANTGSVNSISYLTLASSPAVAVANLDEIAMVYGFVNSLERNETPTNLPSATRKDTIEIISRNLVQMLELGKSFLDKCEEDKVVTISVPENQLGSSRYNDFIAISTRGIITTRELNFIFKDAFDEISDKISTDVLGTVLGSTLTVVRAMGLNVPSEVTVEDLIANQDKFLNAFREYINISTEANTSRTINNIKNIILNVSEKTYDELIDDPTGTIGVDVEFISKKEYMDEVNNYINSADSNDILDTNSNVVAFYIIGKILFSNTNFYKFSMLTDSKKFEGDESITFAEKLSRRDYIFVAAVELLADSILDGITEV